MDDDHRFPDRFGSPWKQSYQTLEDNGHGVGLRGDGPFRSPSTFNNSTSSGLGYTGAPTQLARSPLHMSGFSTQSPHEQHGRWIDRIDRDSEPIKFPSRQIIGGSDFPPLQPQEGPSQRFWSEIPDTSQRHTFSSYGNLNDASLSALRPTTTIPSVLPRAQVFEQSQNYVDQLNTLKNFHESPNFLQGRPVSHFSRRPERSPISLGDFLSVEGHYTRPIVPPVQSTMANYYRSHGPSWEDPGSNCHNHGFIPLQHNPNPAMSDFVNRRGKERMTPKKKKISALKKVILKERAEKKESTGKGGESPGGSEEEKPTLKTPERNDTGEGTSEPDKFQDNSGDSAVTEGISKALSGLKLDSELSVSGKEGIKSDLEEGASPLGSRGSSEGIGSHGSNSFTNMESISTDKKPTTYIGPSVNIRYCNQIISLDLNKVTMDLLRELIRFQERAKAREPLKAKVKRRLVVGLREVSRSIRSGRAKCIVVAPNIEEIKSEGGLDETVQNVLDSAAENKCEVVFALTRSKIAQAFGRRVRMSTVAICDYDGANDLYKEMLRLAAIGRQQWQEIHGSKSQSEEKS